MEDYQTGDHRKMFLNRLKEHGAKFTPSDHKIAEYLVTSYPSSLLHNVSEIAEKLGINIATVSRFFPKIGYQSIREARSLYRKDLEFIANSPLDRFQQQKDHHDSGFQAIQKTLEYDYQISKRHLRTSATMM